MLFVMLGEVVVALGIVLVLILIAEVAGVPAVLAPILPPTPVEVVPGTVVLVPAVPDGVTEVVPEDVVVADVVPETAPPAGGTTVVAVLELGTVEPAADVLRVVEPGPLTLLPVEVDDVVVEGVGAGPVPSPEPATPAKTFVSYFRVFSNSRACSSLTFSSLSTAARSIRS